MNYYSYVLIVQFKVAHTYAWCEWRTHSHSTLLKYTWGWYHDVMLILCMDLCMCSFFPHACNDVEVVSWLDVVIHDSAKSSNLDLPNITGGHLGSIPVPSLQLGGWHRAGRGGETNYLSLRVSVTDFLC